MYQTHNSIFVLVLVLFFVEADCRVKIGHLQTLGRGVKGTVYALNKDTLLIQQFTFMGKSKCGC
jgi:hypothetical protein